MSIGLIARCDQGGIAVQSHALFRWLKPEHVLVVDLPPGKCRGEPRLERFKDGTAEVDVCTTDVIPAHQLVELAQKVDVIVTVECLYAPPATWVQVNRECEVLLVANPELYVNYPAKRVVLPTSWMQDRMPPHKVIPHPVDVDAVQDRRRVRGERAKTFLHVEAPAMLDRNGTNLVYAALSHIDEPCTLIVRSFQPAASSCFGGFDRVGNVRIVWDSRRVEEWHEGYDDDVDALVLPRRYGGLSLVVQEAAAFGVPSLMLDVDPQRAEGWPGWRIPAHTTGGRPMRGGVFDVHTGDPATLGGRMSALARGDLNLEAESRAALDWSEARSWPNLLPAWQAACA